MITAIDIKTVGITVDKPTRRYVEKKIGPLDSLLPKRARQNVDAVVTLALINQPHGNKYEAEVVIKAGDQTIVARDTTLNVLAAIDIVRAKIVAQLKR